MQVVCLAFDMSNERAHATDRYEKLAYKALPIWQAWTKTIHETAADDLPAGLSPSDTLLTLCGVMRLGQGKELSQYYIDILDGCIKQNRRDRVFMLNDQGDYARAGTEDKMRPGMSWAKKLHRYGGLMDGNIHGMMDMDTGFTRADKVGRHLINSSLIWQGIDALIVLCVGSPSLQRSRGQIHPR